MFFVFIFHLITIECIAMHPHFYNPNYKESQDNSFNRKEKFYTAKIKNLQDLLKTNQYDFTLNEVGLTFNDFLEYQNENPIDFKFYTKAYYDYKCANFFQNKISLYLKKQPWNDWKNKEGFISYEVIKKFFPLIQLINDTSHNTDKSKNTTHSFDYYDETNTKIEFGSYVHIITPARKMFLTDNLSLQGDVVILGAGLCDKLCAIIKDPSVTRLILNDLNLIPLLVSAYNISKQPCLNTLAQKKLVIHYGKVQNLYLQEKSIQKIYAGYLIKYLSEEELENLAQNIDNSLIDKGRFYIDEVNIKSDWWTINEEDLSHYFEWNHFLKSYNNFDVLRQREQASHFTMNDMSYVTRYLVLQKKVDKYSTKLTHELTQNFWVSLQEEWIAVQSKTLASFCILPIIVLTLMMTIDYC